MQMFNHEKKKKDIVQRNAERMVEEELFTKIKNNVKTYRFFNNPADSQVELAAVLESVKPVHKTVILWEDEMVVQNLNTAFLDELFDDTKK